MAATLTYNIELEEGAALVHTFSYLNDFTNLPKDTTGIVVELQIKFENLPTAIIYRSTIGPYILLGGSTGTIDITIPWLSIFNEDIGRGIYNLYITDVQGITTMHSKGFFTIVHGTTPVTIPGANLPGGSSTGNIFLGVHTSDTSLSVVLASDHPTINVSSTGGLGTLAPLPAGDVNGTPLGVLPAKSVGARLYLSGPDSVTFTISGSAPATPPSCTFTLTPTTTGPNWDENLSSGQMIYLTEVLGTPKFRWI